MFTIRGISPDADDTITIKCPDREDGAGRNFNFRRFVLRRSPTLAKFFDSPYYLRGCDMRLTFVVDPAVCLDIAYKYLEEGPDIFQQTILRVQLTMRYKLVGRSVILIRLHALAQKLALPGLMNMAFGVLIEGDPQIKAADCITFSSLIFARMANFDRRLKEWCINHVTRYLPELEHLTIWQEVLWKADLELPQRWAQLLEAKGSRLHTVDQGVEDKEMNAVIKNGALEVPSPHSASTVASKEQSFQDVLDEVAQGNGMTEETEEEWEITEALCASSERRGTSGKLNRLLGMYEKSPSAGLKREESWPRGMSPSPSSLFSPGIDKAHFVMGYPGTTDQVEKNRRSSFTSATPLPTPTKVARKTRLLAGF